LSVIRADRLLAHRCAVDLGEVRTDLPSRQTLGIQRQHDLIDTVQPPLPLAHDLRFERPSSVSWHVNLHVPARLGQHRLGPRALADVARPDTVRIMLFIAQVLGHLLAQRGLDHRLRQLLEQTVPAGQRQALLLGQPDQLDRPLRLR